MISQQDLTAQMIAQLRVIDPSASAEVGTPERKIFDVFGQALYDSQIDIAALNNSLNLDDKFGAQLDRFLAIFGFGRQAATYAAGFVTFSRLTPSTLDIRIPAGTTVQAPISLIANPNDSTTNVSFVTLYDVILLAGDLSIVAPIRCTTSGKVGNVPANTITEFIGSPVYGITGVTNEIATANGLDAETDEEFKLRFRNTVFRNLAGTQDQYLALAISTAFTSKANVIGPISLYREYIQVPAADDATAYDVDYPVGGDTEAGGGNAGEYTSALSTIPYAKDIWEVNPAYISSNNSSAVAATFYREGVDFTFNWNAAGVQAIGKNVGDTLRFATATPNILDTRTPGSIGIPGITAEPPNVTFINVYTGINPDIVAVRPNDVVLLEYQYLSSASRNSKALNITNAVDVFIDGGNDTKASCIIPRPSSSDVFVDDITSKYHYENYRRIGDPTKRPVVGNILTPLFWQPVTGLPENVPETITVTDITYYKGIHYWAVEDVSNLRGSVRARNGIEWAYYVHGFAAGDSGDDPSGWTGAYVWDDTSDPPGGVSLEIIDYTYDKNIVDLQAALEGSRQITTDVLARKAKTRYFKLDLSIMYTPGISTASINESISSAVDSYLKSLYFGSAIQLSDLLQVVHNVGGVDNVRWTADSPAARSGDTFSDQTRVYETDQDGRPLLGVSVERVRPGDATRTEIQALYLTGRPTSGSFILYGYSGSTTLAYNASATDIQTALRTLSGDASLTVTEDTRSTDQVLYPIRSFKITWSVNGAVPILETSNSFLGGDYSISADFYLRDDELAALAVNLYTDFNGNTDSAAGIIARPRAQNTWVRTN